MKNKIFILVSSLVLILGISVYSVFFTTEKSFLKMQKLSAVESGLSLMRTVDDAIIARESAGDISHFFHYKIIEVINILIILNVAFIIFLLKTNAPSNSYEAGSEKSFAILCVILMLIFNIFPIISFAARHFFFDYLAIPDKYDLIIVLSLVSVFLFFISLVIFIARDERDEPVLHRYDRVGIYIFSSFSTILSIIILNI